MALLFVEASSEYLGTTAPLTAAPFMTCCWAYNDELASADCMISLQDASEANQQWVLKVQGDVGGDPVRWSVRTGGGFANAETSTGMTINQWHHCAGIEAGTALRRAMIDGGSDGTDVADRTPTGVDTFEVGRFGDSSPGNYWSGGIAEVGLWDLTNWGASASARESAAIVAVQAMAKGISPLQFPIGLVGYWPIWGIHSSEIDLHPKSNVATDYSLTINATPTRIAHPPVVPFSRKMWLPETTIAAAVSSRTSGLLLSGVS